MLLRALARAGHEEAPREVAFTSEGQRAATAEAKWTVPANAGCRRQQNALRSALLGLSSGHTPLHLSLAPHPIVCLPLTTWEEAFEVAVSLLLTLHLGQPIWNNQAC